MLTASQLANDRRREVGLQVSEVTRRIEMALASHNPAARGKLTAYTLERCFESPSYATTAYPNVSRETWKRMLDKAIEAALRLNKPLAYSKLCDLRSTYWSN